MTEINEKLRRTLKVFMDLSSLDYSTYLTAGRVYRHGFQNIWKKPNTPKNQKEVHTSLEQAVEMGYLEAARVDMNPKIKPFRCYRPKQDKIKEIVGFTRKK